MAALWVVALVVFMSGWAVFLYRGLLPGSLFAADDFRVIYISSRAWLYGLNPYDADRLDSTWAVADGPAQYRPSARGSQDLLYPPPTFVVVSPVAALDWPQARGIWAQVNLAAIGVTIISIVSLLGVRWRDPSTWIFVGAAIAFAPAITGVKVGQMSMIVVALIASAHALRAAGWAIAGGVLLGLAGVLKPQIGLIFVAYEVFRWRWRLAGPALAVAALVALVGVVRLEIAGVPWLETLSANVRNFTTGIGNANPLPENPHRYQMIDLRPVVHNFTDNRALALVGVMAIAGALGVAALGVWMRKQEDERELLALSIGAAGGLLIAYHRFYDAAVLLLPLGWLVWALVTPEGRRFGWTRWLVLLGLLPFFAPGAAALHTWTQSGRVPHWLGDHVLWDTFVVHHQAWALVWLTGSLVVAMARCPAREKPALAWLPRPSLRRRGAAPAGE